MSIVDFRADLMTLYRTTFDKRPDLRIGYENGPAVDFDTSTVPYLQMDIIYSDATQRDISENPWITDKGTVLFSIFVKENSNNLVATKLIQELRKNFQLKSLGLARLYEASAKGSIT